MLKKFSIRSDRFNRGAARTPAAMMAIAGALLAGAVPAWGQATEVGRFKVVKDIGGGKPNISIKLKNVCGEDAYDVTLSLEDAGDVKIKCIDIHGTLDDGVDDNGNGKLDKGEEADTCAETPSTVVTSLLGGTAKIENDEEREISIEFTGETPKDAKLRVKFSKVKDDGVHEDMVSFVPLDPADPTGGSLDVTTGTGRLSTGVINVGDQSIDSVQFSIEPFLEPYMPPECIVGRPAEVLFDGKVVRVVFDEPVAPGELVELGIRFPLPISTPRETFSLIFAASGAVGCYAGCDGDGELGFFDFLCFQNAFAAGEAVADCDGDGALGFFDFLCFQNAFAAGCAVPDCLPDIRTTVHDAAADPPEIQRRYDAINRSLHLYGDLSLEEVLMSPIEGLLPALLAKVETMEACTGLRTDILAMEVALFDLAAAAAGAPVSEALTGAPGSSPDLEVAIRRLQDLGIEFPELPVSREEAQIRAGALPFVLGAAGGLQVKDLLFKTHLEIGADAFEAVQTGLSVGLLHTVGLDNDRCCIKDGGTPIGGFKTDKCEDRDAWTWCNLSSGALCSGASKNCP